MDTDEIFFAALELEGSAREQFIAQACAADGKVRADVESLLAAHERAGEFLRTPVVPPSFSMPSAEQTGTAPGPESWIGRQIGAYRVARFIGEGGMGTVFIAHRADEQFQKRVAIKLIRAGMASADVLRRFRTERQVLAQLDHPNIARLIDGGATDDGVPYLVMEYVEGVPIDDFCRRGRSSIADRLVLFRKVCGAVAYAHQHLVVHRDLKPGNILITYDGEPKLLDFGIAKVLGASASESGVQTTAPALRMLTPRYASPEQLRGQPMTTASDVYSLGVILYELLTGLRPFDVQTNSLHELEHLVCTQEPTRPSTVVRRATQTSPGRHEAASRSGDVSDGTSDGDMRRWGRKLAGDLDNIILMALRKEPPRRYASVVQLSDDIRRHLEGLPVSARPDTLRYRVSKFIRRNTVAVASAAVLLIGLVAATVTSTTLYFRAESAKRESETQRVKAEQINLFLKDMLASIDPAYARGRDVSILREVVDQAAGRMDADLGGVPDVAASLHLTIGEVYTAIASHKEAERHIRRSIELYRSTPSDHRLDEANSLLALAQLLRDRSRYEEAEPLFAESIRIREKALGIDHGDVAEAIVSFGVHLEHTGQYVKAEAAYRRALEIQERAADKDPIAVSTTLANLGLFLMYQNREPEAEVPLRRALEIRRAALDGAHVSLIEPLVNLAGWLRRGCRFQEARAHVEGAIDICRAQLAPEHPKTLNALGNLAAILQDMGEFEAAEPVYRETVELQKRVNGVVHKETATTTNNLASLLRRMGKREEAVALFEEVADAYRQVLGEDHYWVSIALNNLGGTLIELRRFSEAEPLLEEALHIRRLHNAADWQIAEAETWLAACLAHRCEWLKAESMLLRGLPALESHDAQSRAVRDALTQLVNLYELWNKPERAAEHRVRLLAKPPPH